MGKIMYMDECYTVAPEESSGWTLPVSISSGDTSVTITDSNIHTDSNIKPYIEPYSDGSVLGFSRIQVTEGQAVITFTEPATANTSVKLEFVGLSAVASGGATVTVSYTSDYYNKTITCTKGSKTYTKLTTSSGSTTFDVDEGGVWTIVCNGVTVNVTVVLDYETTLGVTISVTLYSAVNDDVTFTDLKGAHTVQTNSAGVASNVQIVFEESNPKITFTSSVAKNPDLLTADYSKIIRMTSSTTEVRVMPDIVLYWYGYENISLTGGEDLTTWARQYTVRPISKGTANANSYSCGGSAGAYIGYGTINKIDITNYSNLKVMLSAISGEYIEYYNFLQASNNKTVIGDVDTTPTSSISQQPVTRATTTGVTSLDISSYSGEYAIGYYTYHSGASTMTALWLEAPNFFSAANDTVYYYEEGLQKTFATTDANGGATIDYANFADGEYTLYSTVAKDPSNLNNPYTKTVTIGANTTEVKVMPEGAVYWYGNICTWLTGGQNFAGWTNSVAGTSIGNGTANTHSYTSGGVSASMRGYGTVNKIDITDFDSLKIILTEVTGGGSYMCYLQASSNKSTVTNLDGTTLNPQPAKKVTTTGVGTLDISSYSGEYGIAEYAYHTSTNTMTAMWLE